MELFGDSDYVVSATVSPNYTLTRELIEPKLKGPVTLIDLAVPRDIDPGAASLPGVTLYDIDCFQEEARSEEQKKAIREAEKIFEEQMEEFYVWYECRDMIPKIQEIKEKAALDLGLRLQKKIRNLPVTPGRTGKTPGGDPVCGHKSGEQDAVRTQGQYGSGKFSGMPGRAGTGIR